MTEKSKMTDAEKAALAEYAARWKRVSVLLEQERSGRNRDADPAAFVALTTDLYDFVLVRSGGRPSSGLVEQQAVFRRMAKP